jgi:hypothetical protein
LLAENLLLAAAAFGLALVIAHLLTALLPAVEAAWLLDGGRAWCWGA